MGKIVNVNSYPEEIAVFLTNYQNYYSFKKVKINGIIYKIGMYLVSRFDNDDPVFEKIMIILRSGISGY